MADPRDLAVALLSELKNQNVSVSKTKFLKLLYLWDVEYWRCTGRLATGWHWTFHHYGPWTQEYDELLHDLSGLERIRVVPLASDIEASLIKPVTTTFDISHLGDADLEFTAKRVLRQWASLPLPELLDYVYFKTEPMESAIRGKPLDFNSVVHARPERYQRAKSDATPRELARARQRLEEILSRSATPTPVAPDAPRPGYTPPRYDPEVIEAFESLEDD